MTDETGNHEQIVDTANSRIRCSRILRPCRSSWTRVRAVGERGSDRAGPLPSAGLRSTAEDNFINFDNVEAPCSFAQTVALTDEYAAQGVFFSGPGGIDGGAIVNECGDFDVVGHSPPNFLAFNVGALLSDGGIPQGPETLMFDPLAKQVTINAGIGFSLQGSATMECFDTQGVSIGSDSINVLSGLQPLSVVAPAIESCVLSFTSAAIVFDDLRWEVRCGDGVVDPGEECDDGNNVDGDGCSADCEFGCGMGVAFFSQTILALGRDVFGWQLPVDVDFVRGDLALVSVYDVLEQDSAALVTSIPAPETPASGEGFYWVIRVDCPNSTWGSGGPSECNPPSVCLPGGRDGNLPP